MKLHIDGHNEEGFWEGDAVNPPFAVFDEDKQQNVAGPYATRHEAVVARRRIRAGRFVPPPTAKLPEEV